MTVRPRTQICKLDDLDIDQTRLHQALQSTRHNSEYFLEHSEELFEQCPTGWILIYGDHQVEMFDDILEAAERREKLKPREKDGSIVRHHRSGTWIL